MMYRQLKGELLIELNELKSLNPDKLIRIIKKHEKLYDEMRSELIRFEVIACMASGIYSKELFKKNRKREIVWTRMVCINHAVCVLGFEEEEIALWYKKDRSTILHALNKYKDLENDKLFREFLGKLELI